jgi:signal transduction histidine kinase
MQPQDVISNQEDVSAHLRIVASPGRDLFRTNELLVDISEKAYAQFEKKIDILHCGPGEVVFEEDEPGDCLYLIAQGSVKISKRGRAGQQETLAYLMERDFFGEMALVDSGKRSAQAATVAQAVLGRVDQESWDLLLHLAPHEVMGNFTRTITKRLRDNNQHFIEGMMRNERLSLLGTTISSIMHDMNNPIACIRGACEVMRANVHDELTEKMAGLIRDAVEKMEMMTRELIDYSRGNTQLNLQSISVSDFLQQLEPDFAKCRPGINVRIEISYDGALHVDRHRLLRVFGNLIRNAREAMQKNSGHMLRFVVKQVDANVRFEVSDTGCGIPHELLPRIFEPFVTHGKANGTGLGLAVSKAVVDAHKGTISVRSIDKGTSFQIDLPLHA